MKRCPECGREYDNSMMFCLDDGTELLYGPASTDEPATAILSEHGVPPSGGSSDNAKSHLLDSRETKEDPQSAILVSWLIAV